MTSGSMHYNETAPPKYLQRHVECFWQFETGKVDEHAPTHVIVPDGTVSISCVFMASRQYFVGLSGPSMAAHQTHLIPNTKYCGIRLRAGAAGSILKTDISRFRDSFGPVPQPIPEAFQIMEAAASKHNAADDILAMLESAAESIVMVSAQLDEPVFDYCTAIMRSNGNGSLADFAQAAPIGVRQLRRRFACQCGLSAKEFARLRRARHACLVMLQNPDDGFAQAATRAGFSDQAHMTREFGDIFGGSTKLITDYLQQISHGNFVHQNG